MEVSGGGKGVGARVGTLDRSRVVCMPTEVCRDPSTISGGQPEASASSDSNSV